jgi:hypothetical protein
MQSNKRSCGTEDIVMMHSPFLEYPPAQYVDIRIVSSPMPPTKQTKTKTKTPRRCVPLPLANAADAFEVLLLLCESSILYQHRRHRSPSSSWRVAVADVGVVCSGTVISSQ